MWNYCVCFTLLSTCFMTRKGEYSGFTKEILTSNKDWQLHCHLACQGECGGRCGHATQCEKQEVLINSENNITE